MQNWYNESAKPLSAQAWLAAHHSAKENERKAFGKKIAAKKPGRVVDLGCGPGFWLQTLDTILDVPCELFGIDTDDAVLKTARAKFGSVSRQCKFVQLDIELESEQIPDADIYLAFNIFPYLKKPQSLLETLHNKIRKGGTLIVRQYDGSMIRFGPMAESDRNLIDTSLKASLVRSEQFRHYDLDRIFSLISQAPFAEKEIGFELFHRIAPYSQEFLPYLRNTIEWTREHTSDRASASILQWQERFLATDAKEFSYFTCADLVAWLS